MPILPLPFSQADIAKLVDQYGTPIYLYDESGIRATARRLLHAFSWNPGFKEFFAVKATPNPAILSILREEGLGADCSSLPELVLAERSEIRSTNIMFTSNQTPLGEYRKAKELGAIINFDDISHIEYVEKHVGLPELVSVRYNPGPRRQAQSVIGKPEEAKFGFTQEQVFEGFQMLARKGVKRFALHTMISSNEKHVLFFTETARMLFELALSLYQRLGIRTEFVNLGGGIGIPYCPEETAASFDDIGQGVARCYRELIAGTPLAPLAIAMENGRAITGPHGILITRVIHKKAIYKNYIGVDACMANLMRPAMYGAYHHITVLGKEDRPPADRVDVVGSLCENNDKFAIDRLLPPVDIGDLLILHDCGAHGHSMGFQYNGKLRCAELLRRTDGGVVLIRRKETMDDYFATLHFPAQGIDI